MNNLDKLAYLRQKYYRDSKNQFSVYLNTFYDGLSLFIDASDLLVETEKVSNHHTVEGASKTAAWRFISTLPTSLFWCCEISLSGDYAIAKNILRLTLEEFVKLAYYVTFPEKALRQVAHGSEKDEVDLNNMLKEMDFEHRKNLMRLHGELSIYYSHANYNLPQELIFQESGKRPQIGGGPHYSSDLFEPIIQQLIIIIANSIKYMVNRFPYLLENETWLKRFEGFVTNADNILPDEK